MKFTAGNPPTEFKEVNDLVWEYALRTIGHQPNRGEVQELLAELLLCVVRNKMPDIDLSSGDGLLIEALTVALAATYTAEEVSKAITEIEDDDE